LVDSNKKHAIRWICGAASGELWRQSLLLQSHRVIYITEGETDALTLLSFGIEEPGHSLVLALAGAQMMPKPEPLEGKDIVIVPDPDQAGKRAEKKLRELLQPLAGSITTVLLREVLNG
jgi:DNA primase